MSAKYQIHDFFGNAFKGFAALVLAVLVTFVLYKMQHPSAKVPGAPAAARREIPLLSSNRVTVSYTQPFVCQATVREATMSAYRDGSSIAYVSLKGKSENRLLFQGDCLYSWDTGLGQGIKVCNVGKYLQIADTLLSTGLLKADSAFDNLPQGVDLSAWGLNPGEMKALIASCRNKRVADRSVFAMPKGIVFRELKPEVTPGGKP